MQAIKGQKFGSWRSIGSVRQQVEIYEARGVDELIVLEIGTPSERFGPNFALIRELTGRCFMPVTIGGGFRQPADFQLGLANGADKICLCYGALWVDRLIERAAEKCGSQSVVACLEHFEHRPVCRTGVEKFHQLEGSIADWVKRLADRGAGEILLNSIDRDGMLCGYDLRAIAEAARAVSVPIVALGGAGEPLHFLDALQCGAHACAAGAIFAFTEYTPKIVVEFLAAKGISVRIEK
jgi:cyclase